MQHIFKQAVVPYSDAQMYDLVDDVNAYSEFLPWCSESNELVRTDTEVTGEIVLKKGLITQSFTTKNLNTTNQKIEMNLVEGPFSELHGVWNFKTLDSGGCKVTLEMDFSISNPILRVTLEPVFTSVLSRLVDAFKQRATAVYG